MALNIKPVYNPAYSTLFYRKWTSEITGDGKTLFDLSFWPNDLSPCDHCASNGGLMPNKNHSDDKCDVKRSFPGFLSQIFSSGKFLPPQSDSGSVPRSDRVTNSGGQRGDTCLDTQSPPLSIQTQTHSQTCPTIIFCCPFRQFQNAFKILLKVCGSWYPLSKPD